MQRPASFKSLAARTLHGQHGDAVQIAAIEATHRLMADYINRESEPVRY